MLNKKPMILILAGPNGSGKSTITQYFEKIVERYYKSLNNIKKLMEICDILHVYDNTVEPVRIIRKHKEDISIFPNDLWPEDKILELIEEVVE